MKKFITAILAAAIAFSPVGSAVFHDQSTTVEARGSKGGGFKSTNGSVNSPSTSTFQNKKANSAVSNKSTYSTKKKNSFFSSRLMKGLMLGGLAGLIFGSLLSSMGMLGSVLGLLVNVLAIIVIIAIIRKIFFRRRANRYYS